MATRFSYIHLSDAHFCTEPVRSNAIALMQRRPRDLLDTIGVAQTQISAHGFWSLPKPASYIPDITSGVAQFCFQRRTVVDGILVTGDLATTGLTSDINVAKSFIEGVPDDGYVTNTLSPTLMASNRPIHILPGNHDKFTNTVGTPNCPHFELSFFKYMQGFGDGVGHWVKRKKRCLIGFLYADFCLRSRMDALDKAVGAYGQGRVYDEVLAELKKRTFALREKYPGIFFVWIIHFAPFECGYRLRLIDFDTIIESALALGVVATLCGHTHKASKFEKDQHVVYCSGSAGCADSENDSRIHVVHLDVDDDCHISRENYKWSARQHEFVYLGDD